MISSWTGEFGVSTNIGEVSRGHNLLKEAAMENSTSKPVEQPKDERPKIMPINENDEAKAANTEEESDHVIKDDKSDSDTHSDDLSSNDEQNNVVSNSNSQFYESSDSKVDYAVKIDDSDTLSDIDDIKTDSASADSEDSALGSLPPDTVVADREEEVQDRSEGSDSGIGSETIEDVKLPSFNLALPCSSSLKVTNNTELVKDSISNYNSNNDKNVLSHKSVLVNVPQKSNLKRKPDQENDKEPQTKKRKEGIKFDNVTVYYFTRAQGFSCVPSQGGSTLGMEWQHSHIQKFTLAEHALEQRRIHRQILQQLKSERHSLQGASLSSSEDSETEEEASDISESELDLDSYYFLQPVPTRQRRALLRAAGVRKIEGYEKNECRDIRTSREFCGCACKVTCNPDTCSCSLAGIKCQVDRLNFPCGCTRDGCCNTTGRIEFNPVRVRTHFIHTLMRVGLERKNEENREAAKRQWVAAHNAHTNSCTPSTSYDSERNRIQEDGLLREVNLTPRVEVESCVNAGNFSNIHCNRANVAALSTSQAGMTYGYRNENCDRRNLSFDNTSNHHNHADPYTSNMLQGKGPPYSGVSTMGYETMTSNMQRFHCDLNYTYEQPSTHNDNQHYKGSQSYSASSFEEFAHSHSSQMSMFSHYGHMYAPDYMHKPTTSMHDHNSLQYHNMHHNHYEMYKNTGVNNEVKSDYSALTMMPYQNSNKMQTVENDENWFSHNTLLGLDHTDQTTQDASELTSQTAAQAPADSNNTETTENFGELIKKTMVESVTV